MTLCVLAGSIGIASTNSLGVMQNSEDPYPAGYRSVDLYSGSNQIDAAPATGAASYTPDLRPGYVILAYTGPLAAPGNDSLLLGRRGWWRDRTDDGFEMGSNETQLSVVIPAVPGNGTTTANNGIVDAVDMLLAMLEQGYDLGFRRFIINRPAGFHEDLPADLTNACWWSLDEDLRESLEDDSSTAGSAGGLAWWIANRTDATVGIYVGFRTGDPWSAFHSEDPLDADRRADAVTMYRNVKPWVELGVTEFVFDHVGGIVDAAASDFGAEIRSDSLHRLRAHSEFSGLYISGEHPVMSKDPDGGGGYEPSGILDTSRVEDNPWYVAVERLETSSVDEDRQWDISAISGEINVGFSYYQPDPKRDFDRYDIADFTKRGFTPWVWGAARIDIWDESMEMIRWVYYDDVTNPTLEPDCLADLDLDGDIDVNDFLIVQNNASSPPAVIYAWDGDLNLDGVINVADITLWQSIATAAGFSGTPVNCP